MAEVEFHLHNEVGIKFPPLRPAYTDGDLYFGRFRELVARSTGTSVIGEGGTGRIHMVRDELMEREVALKIPLQSILRDPAARADVIQETRQAMDLTHPNIVRIHDFHEGDGQWGISMQYVRGKNLDERRYDAENTGSRRAIRPNTVEAIRDWIAQLCDALRYAHEDARMVHRDIKPKNLMLERRDGGEKLYITDFGISQRLRQHGMQLSRDQNESKGNMGTLPYMPWEQIAGAPASPLDDVYAVGATIYDLITGRPPFYDGGFEQIKVQIREVVPPSMGQRMLELGLHMPPPPDEWEKVVAKCLAKRPEDRPQSMRAVAAELGFQSGNNTELEVRIVSQARRINELENQIIALTENLRKLATGGNPKSEERLAAALRELEDLSVQAERSQSEVLRLEAIMAAAVQNEQDLSAQLAVAVQNEQSLAAKLASTRKQLEGALEGGDEAFEKIREELARRITELERELDAALANGGELAKQTRQLDRKRIAELEADLGIAADKAERMLQKVRREAEESVRKATDSLKKAGEEKAMAVAEAREEGAKRMHRLVQEQEQVRQSLSRLADQNERLERRLATERERKGASLKPLLVSLLVAMVLGLAGGFVTSFVLRAKGGTGSSEDPRVNSPSKSRVPGQQDSTK